MEQVPETLSWVEKIHACSVKGEFLALMDEAVKSAQTRNQLFQTPQPSGPFIVSQSGDDKFRVFYDTTGNALERNRPVISFTIENRSIIVEKREVGAIDERRILEIKPSVDERGKCMLKVGNNRYLYRWQVLKETLEDLFFG